MQRHFMTPHTKAIAKEATRTAIRDATKGTRRATTPSEVLHMLKQVEGRDTVLTNNVLSSQGIVLDSRPAYEEHHHNGHARMGSRPAAFAQKKIGTIFLKKKLGEESEEPSNIQLN